MPRPDVLIDRDLDPPTTPEQCEAAQIRWLKDRLAAAMKRPPGPKVGESNEDRARRIIRETLQAYSPFGSGFEVQVVPEEAGPQDPARWLLAELDQAQESAWRLGALRFCLFEWARGSDAAAVAVTRSDPVRLPDARVCYWRVTHALGRMRDERIARLAWDLQALRVLDWSGGVGRTGTLIEVGNERLRAPVDPDQGKVTVNIKLRLPARPAAFILLKGV